MTISRLLIKFPTRSRPVKFFEVLNRYYGLANNVDNIRFVITLDFDDSTMNNPSVIQKLNNYRNLEYYFGTSKTKIEAVNADIYDLEWDILLLASDDMIPIVQGYDDIICNEMETEHPDTDGVLWFFDGHRDDLNTLCILGREYYKRFNYIYNPEYITWYADDEFMRVSRLLGKETAYDTCIIEHRHPIWVGGKKDALYHKQNSNVLTSKDKATYERRLSQNFGIDQFKLSILICTITQRKRMFDKLITQLEPQLTNDVEVLYLSDSPVLVKELGRKVLRGEPIGKKRNQLLQSAKGKYVCFIDDDDRISDDYIVQILKGIEHDPDCCSLMGNIRINGKYPKLFIHSIDYKVYSESKTVYYRPPNHLNAIRRSIAQQFVFPELNRNEDTNWAMQISDAGVLKTEYKIDKVIYFYDYISRK